MVMHTQVTCAQLPILMSQQLCHMQMCCRHQHNLAPLQLSLDETCVVHQRHVICMSTRQHSLHRGADNLECDNRLCGCSHTSEAKRVATKAGLAACSCDSVKEHKFAVCSPCGNTLLSAPTGTKHLCQQQGSLHNTTSGVH